MFKENSDQVILDRMLEHVDDSLDKREGSVIWDALAPTALEHQLLYTDMDSLLDASFVTKAPREYLVEHAKERGFRPHPATPAVWRAEFSPAGLQIILGTRFNVNAMNLYASSKVEDGVYELTCETPGTSGNSISGSLIPMEYIPGLESAKLTTIVTQGADEEETEDFRKRYLTFLQTPAASGNKADYINWATSVDGTGNARCLDADVVGAGNVEVVITDANRRAASESLCNKVWTYIETVRPIGPTVKVTSAEEVALNITAKVTLDKGFSLQQVIESFKQDLADFLSDAALVSSIASIAKIGNILIDTNGVDDYENLRINNGSTNITLTDRQIAVPGTVSLEVSST